MKFSPLLCLPLLLSACQKLPSTKPGVPTQVSEGQAFAQSSCGSCHAVRRSALSPISTAPSFPVIVNQQGVTADTLSTWLRGAHNYPREMDFYLHERDVNLLVAYMLTLKDPNFRRPPD